MFSSSGLFLMCSIVLFQTLCVSTFFWKLNDLGFILISVVLFPAHYSRQVAFLLFFNILCPDMFFIDRMHNCGRLLINILQTHTSYLNSSEDFVFCTIKLSSPIVSCRSQGSLKKDLIEDVDDLSSDNENITLILGSRQFKKKRTKLIMTKTFLDKNIKTATLPQSIQNWMYDLNNYLLWHKRQFSYRKIPFFLYIFLLLELNCRSVLWSIY